MRVLLTGGAGFIGSHLADALLEAGHELLIIDDLSSGYQRNVPAAARFEHASILNPQVVQHIAAFAPVAAFHLAAQMDVRRSVADPGFDAQVNVEGTVRMLDACTRAGTETFIFASSGGAIYGEQERFPADESHPCRPESPYGVSKLCGEHYLSHFQAAGGLRTVALRFANIYGPRQDPHGEAGVVAIFCGKLLRGEPPTINGDGEQTRDYTYVTDVVAACMKALDNPNAKGPYNIGTGIETSVNELAETLSRHAGFSGQPTFAPARRGEQGRSVIDPGRAHSELGWQPTIGLADGLGQTLERFAKGP